MNSKKIIEKLFNIATKQQQMIVKLAQGLPPGSKHNQAGTTELFFTNEANQRAFAATIGGGESLVYKVLLNAFNKAGGKIAVSFDLKMEATPNVGAKWILTTNPPAIKTVVLNAINTEYQKLMGQSMPAKLAEVDAKAKAGAGSGTADVSSAELNP